MKRLLICIFMVGLSCGGDETRPFLLTHIDDVCMRLHLTEIMWSNNLSCQEFDVVDIDEYLDYWVPRTLDHMEWCESTEAFTMLNYHTCLLDVWEQSLLEGGPCLKDEDHLVRVFKQRDECLKYMP